MAYIPKPKIQITPKVLIADERIALGDTYLYRHGDETDGYYIFTGTISASTVSGNTLYFNDGSFTGLTSTNISTNYITGTTGVICQFTACTANIGALSALTGYVNSFSADTYYSGSTPLQLIIDGSKTKIRNGINTFTGGTAGDYTVNITAATLSNLSVSGISTLNTVNATLLSATTLSANTLNANLYYSAGTPLSFYIPAKIWQVGDGGVDSIKTIAGANTVSGDSSLVMGINNVSYNENTFTNGKSNQNNQEHTTILNGVQNITNNNSYLNSKYSTILNGRINTITNSYGVITGGKFNLNSSFMGFVGGESNSATTGGHSVIHAGNSHLNAGSIYNTILNGKTNTINSSNYYSFIGNGKSNITGAGGYGASIVNGRNNTNSGVFSTINNGSGNTIATSSRYTFIDNGQRNRILTNSKHSSIVNGLNNLIGAYCYRSSIINGENNTISTTVQNSTIIGGTGLTLSDSFTTLVPNLQIATVTSGGTLALSWDPTTRKISYFSPVSGLTGSSSTTSSHTVLPGINTFTGGTSSAQTVNITGGTFNNVTVSGSAIFNTISATTFSAGTYYSGSTPLYNIFAQTSDLSRNINGINTFTAGTASAQSINVTGLTIDNLRVTGATTLGSVTATTYYSGTSELSTLFVTTANTPYEVSYYRKRGSNLTRWYTGGVNAVANSTVSLAKNITRYVPFIVPVTQTISLIACEVTSFGTAGAVARLGIYDSITNTASAYHMQPQNVVADCGTVAIDSNGVKSITGLTVTLTPGLYFLALNHNSTAATTFRSLGAAACPVIFALSTGMGGANATHLTENVTFAAFTTANTSLAAALTLPPIVAVQLA